MLKFRDDASDATAVALWGAMQKHASLSFASPVAFSAPALDEAAAGSKRAVASPGGGGGNREGKRVKKD